jgi:hypothetical protein
VDKWDTSTSPFSTDGSMDELRVYRGVALDAAGIASAMASSDLGVIPGLLVALTFDDPADLSLNICGARAAITGTGNAAGGKLCGVVIAGGGCCPILAPVNSQLSCDQVSLEFVPTSSAN